MCTSKRGVKYGIVSGKGQNTCIRRALLKEMRFRLDLEGSHIGVEKI